MTNQLADQQTEPTIRRTLGFFFTKVPNAKQLPSCNNSDQNVGYRDALTSKITELVHNFNVHIHSREVNILLHTCLYFFCFGFGFWFTENTVLVT